MSCSSPNPKPDWKAYLLGELNPEVSRQAEAHLAACSNCHEEVATLRVTLDTLSTLREEEVPRRIAFVSDKVFEPRWWQRAFIPTFASPTFAAAALVAAAILVHGAMRPGQAQVDAAVTKALSQVEARHTREMQVMFEQLDIREKQVRNFSLTSAALIR
jgi:anti-sigma factor RsiW